MQTLVGHKEHVNAPQTMATSGNNNNNNRLASGSSDRTIRIWDTESGQCVATLGAGAAAGRSSASVTALLMLDARRLAGLFANDTAIRIWEILGESGRFVRSLAGHRRPVKAITLLLEQSPSRRLASAADDGTIRIWDLEAAVCLYSLDLGPCPWALQSLGNGILASGSNDINIKLWNIDAGLCVRPLTGHRGPVRALTLLNQSQLASGSQDKTIKIWSIESGVCVRTFIGHTAHVNALQSLGRNRLASGSTDRSIKIWDVEMNACLRTLTDHTDAVSALQLLGDGRLASASHDKTIKIWSIVDRANSSDVCSGPTLQSLPASALALVLSNNTNAYFYVHRPSAAASASRQT